MNIFFLKQIKILIRFSQDAECFMRLFRENIDEDRTWTNVAKFVSFFESNNKTQRVLFRDKDELESLIKLLITDNVIRKKFPGKIKPKSLFV